MVIILEGVEGTGKSTLIKELQPLLHIPILDFSHQFNHPLRAGTVAEWRARIEPTFASIYVAFKLGALRECILQRSYPTREVYKHFFPTKELITINPKEDLPPHHLLLLTCNPSTIQRRLGYGSFFELTTLLVRSLPEIQERLKDYISTASTWPNVTSKVVDTTDFTLSSYKTLAEEIEDWYSRETPEPLIRASNEI